MERNYLGSTIIHYLARRKEETYIIYIFTIILGSDENKSKHADLSEDNRMLTRLCDNMKLL